ncbi:MULTISPECIES: calcium/sodium antiporter [unclassified Psychrobacter]|uniref:calcium/sodium antiporter n=1 Tax=unclassified Psychrobacter TaxID=196806 RepID=UPI00086CFDEC|nr:MULTISPECIES: calcium/sodium antiporter [unclassified Psychrobacter]OEH68042.1 MAG: calcium/sodium antiporter [Psychrobacter sp. B29-1]PKG64495.1 calcium/sodium antiporter [Psychrobacter sp. Choline-02u-13]PKH48676.1 calcium/sodium antiporter [Psychrobacter sp. Choline-02u-9]|tara:strand:+ start:39374 stop:40399 length:1026 start_codon:yes stop_codon:yes gene_type:complete
MWLAALAILIGLAILVWSADVFIDGATALAKKFSVPSFLIGVLILGIGTSAPEMVVSVLAAIEGSPELALGNAYGSNIINIALVLGATVLISPIIIRRGIVKRDLPLLLLITVIAAWQLRDGTLSQVDGIVLLILLVAVLGLQIIMSIREGYHEHEDDVVVANADSEHSNNLEHSNNSESLEKLEPSVTRGIVSLIIGMLMLVASSRAIVWGAVELATLWGLSELIIGLTIVAVGTSLPELVSSLSAARKGEHDMALGNIIGSNIFNTLAVVGLATVIAPIAADPVILSRDVMAMGVLTILLVTLCVFAFKTKRQFGRTSGATLVLFFMGYTAWLIQSVSM